MSERESPASALQRLASELLRATSPAAIGALVGTTAAELLGADAAVVFARVDATTLEALHTTGWPEELSRPFRRLELHRMGRMDDDAVLEQLAQLRGVGPWTVQMFLEGVIAVIHHVKHLGQPTGVGLGDEQP